MNQTHTANLHGENYILLSFLGLFIYIILINAWVADDAYITFRVLDNLVNGYGLRWNITERVQAFTNPLWLFVHVPFYLITTEVFLTTIFISLLFDIATFLMAVRLFKTSTGFIFAFWLVPLILSKSFVEYATSGLENPLTFFFLALFYLILRTENLSTFKFTCYCFLIAGLAGVNRLDSLIFYLPVLTYLFLSRLSWRTFAAATLGLTPLLLWEMFSLFYYGFLLPNTAYAKLSTGLPAADYFQQGLIYAIDLAKNDPIATVIIILAILTILQSFYHSWVSRSNPTLAQFLGMGFLLYCVYVIKVGGDFMSGRFWTAPFFLAVLWLNDCFRPYDAALGEYKYLIGVVLIGVFMGIFPKSLTQATIPPSGIADERGFYLKTNSLLNYLRDTPTSHDFAKAGIELSQVAKDEKSRSVTIVTAMGMRGFYAGPHVTVIDLFALGDALLARIPVVKNEATWRIGHFIRPIPEGYPEFHQTGSFDKMPKILVEYYKPLHYIIAGPLFDWERLQTIWRFNWGVYDVW